MGLVLIDGRISGELEKGFISRGIGLIKTMPHKALYNAVSCHPDMFFHHLGDEYMLYAPKTDERILWALKEEGFKLIMGGSPLTYNYPGNIPYNAARIGSFAFHNLKYTDPVLKRELEKRGVKLIHVNQGYSKCAVSIVNNQAIITSDPGIGKRAMECKIDVLLTEQKENIRLHEIDHGFIRGSTGLIDKNKWAAAGSIKSLAAFEEIRGFLKRKGLEPVSIYGGPVFDLGSILPLKYA